MAYLKLDTKTKKLNKNYTAKVNDGFNYFVYSIPVSKTISKSGFAYATFPEYLIKGSFYDNNSDIVNYNADNRAFYRPMNVGVVTGYDENHKPIFSSIKMSPADIKAKLLDQTYQSAPERKQALQNAEKSFSPAVKKAIIDREMSPVVMHKVEPDYDKVHHEGNKMVSATRFVVKDKSETASVEKAVKDVATLTTFGVKEASKPSNIGAEYASYEDMVIDVRKKKDENIKEFNKIIESYEKITDWAAENKITLAMSFRGTPEAPPIDKDDAVTLKAYADAIKDWRKIFSDEVTSLKSKGYDVPQELYKAAKPRTHESAYMGMAEFNAARNAKAYTENALIVHSSSKATYLASAFGKYAISEREAKLLENGESVVFADVPVSGTLMKHYIGKLEPIEPAQIQDLTKKKIPLEGHKASDLTHCLVLEEISMTDPRFADVEHNERYRMNQDSYDMNIARASYSSDIIRSTVPKESSHSRGQLESPRALAMPTTKLKSNKLTNSKFSENTFERRLEAYNVLRQEPATETGKKLGFETAWDENRFFDSFSMLQVLSGGSRIRSQKAKLELLDKAVKGDFSGIGVDTTNTKILASFDKPWQDMMKQAQMRQQEPTPAGVSKGYKNAWEEKVASDYETLTQTSFDRTMVTEDIRKTLARYYRLQETMDVRQNGLVTAANVGTDKDKYAKLSVSGLYKPASAAGVAKGYNNRWEERIAESIPADDLTDGLDDIPDFT